MILGIDYGRSKIGLATAEAGFATPWKVIKVGSWADALREVAQVVSHFAPPSPELLRRPSEASRDKQIDLVIVGVAEGIMGEEQRRFAQELQSQISIPVETWDETLSTLDAQQMAIEAGLGQKKRREKEDAFAASVVLQSFLDGKASEGSGNV